MPEENEEPKRVIHWNKRLEEYFSSTGEKAHCLSWLHKRAEVLFSTLTTFIDLPVIIISGVVGAMSIGTESLFGTNSNAPVVLGAFSIFVGVLNTIGTYFSWSKRAEAHRVSSIQYSRLYRQLNVEMSLPRIERTTPDELLKYVRNEYERLSEISPLIPRNIIKKFNILFKEETEISQPEEVNGLEKITVYEGGIEDLTLPPDKGQVTDTGIKVDLDKIAGVNLEEEKKEEIASVQELDEEIESVTSPVLPSLEEVGKKRFSGKQAMTWK